MAGRWTRLRVLAALLMLSIIWAPAALVVAQQGQTPVCSGQTFATGAAAATTDCCVERSTTADSSGHRRRRRQQQGCAVPTTCPSRVCAATFATFFEECSSQLELLPEIAQYQQLHTDCVASFPDSRAPGSSCIDDAEGVLAHYGISCTVLITTGSCETDLSTTGWPVQSGISMRDVCPTACRDPRCISGPSTCQLRASQDHWTSGDSITAQTVGCSSVAVDGATIMGRRVPGPQASSVLQGARWSALEEAQLSRGFFVWHTSSVDYGRWELALFDSGTRACLGEPATVWIAPNPGQSSVQPELYSEEWGLPVVHVSLEGGRRPSDTPQGAVITVRGESVSGSVHVRGATSSSYAKQSFTLKFDGQELGVHEWHGHHHTRGHMILTTTFDDTTYVRQKLVYDLWKAMAEHQGTHRLVPETFFAVVYMNGLYHGLYLGCDRIDDEFVRHLGFPSGEGNMYKAVSHDANFYLTRDGGRRPKGSGSGLRAGYRKVEGAQSDWRDLEELVQEIGGGSDAQVAAGTASGRIDVSEFEDWLILVSYSLSDDSGGKNSYLYHGGEMDGSLGSLFRFVPWDFNDSWGQSWETSKSDASTDQHWTIRRNRVFAALQQDTTGSARLWRRFAGLRDGPLQPSWLHAKVEGYQRLLGQATGRDWDKWGAEVTRRFFRRGSSGTDRQSSSELVYLHGWIDDRDAYWEHFLRALPPAAPVAPCDASQWPDVSQVCGECRVLIAGASERYGGLCDDFCGAVGKRCTGAWEERANSCEVSHAVGCGVSLGDTDDAICLCE
eukprot:COSAG02_NODE_5619_length_4178_cov_2.972297_1_plen_784_part_00